MPRELHGQQSSRSIRARRKERSASAPGRPAACAICDDGGRADRDRRRPRLRALARRAYALAENGRFHFHAALSYAKLRCEFAHRAGRTLVEAEVQAGDEAVHARSQDDDGMRLLIVGVARSRSVRVNFSQEL